MPINSLGRIYLSLFLLFALVEPTPCPLFFLAPTSIISNPIAKDVADNLARLERQLDQPEEYPSENLDAQADDFPYEKIHSSDMSTCYRVNLIKSFLLKTARKKEEIIHLLQERKMLKRLAQRKKGISSYFLNYSEDPRLYFVDEKYRIGMMMEFVENSQSLDEYIEERKRPNEKITLSIIRQILCALIELEEAGIIFNDLKPENILLTFDPLTHKPHITIIDLGLAHAEDEPYPFETDWWGTAEFFPPEVAGETYIATTLQRKKGKEHPISLSSDEFKLLQGDMPIITPQTYSYPQDLWAAGITFYQLLTGRYPFCEDGNYRMQYELFKEIWECQPESIKLNEENYPFLLKMVPIVMKMLSRHPKNRYPSAAAVLAEIERIEEEFYGIKRTRPFDVAV